MASKRKVNLDDYQLTTTLGTGKSTNKRRSASNLTVEDSALADYSITAINKSTNFVSLYRFLWPCIARQK